MWVNKGCGAERNRAALGNFAAYVQQQWSAMHEADTTCTYCGQQFLPSMIEEHQEKCEGASSRHTGARHAGDMLDYLKDDRVLYNRLKKGDYCLQMEPKLEATGESRMNLVLIKQVTCNSCGKSFQANKLDHHRRWECEWDIVKRTDESDTLMRRPGLRAPSQGFKTFKKEIEWAIPSKPADNYIIIEGEQYPVFIPFKNTIDSATRVMLENGYQLNFETPSYKADPVAADAAAAAATALANYAAENVAVAQEKAAKEGLASSENNQFFVDTKALRLQIVSLETKATKCRQAAQSHFNVGDDVSAMREMQRANMLEKQSQSIQVAMDALNKKSDLLEQRELEQATKEAIENIEEGLKIRKVELLGLNKDESSLTDADLNLQDKLDALTQDVEGGLGQLAPNEQLLREMESNENAGDADGPEEVIPYFKLQNQSSKEFLAVEYSGKEESVVLQASDDSDDNQLWSQRPTLENGVRYFRFQHKRTSKWLATKTWDSHEGKPFVSDKLHKNQLWKDYRYDSSSPLLHTLKNHYSYFLGVEKSKTPKVFKFLGSSHSIDSMGTRYLWRFVPHRDIRGGQNIASMQAATDEKEAALQKLKKESAPSADQAAAKADLEASEDALREAEQTVAQDFMELQGMADASASAIVQLIDYAKETADAALAFDKLTATMIFVGAFYLSIIHQFTPYSNTRLPTYSQVLTRYSSGE